VVNQLNQEFIMQTPAQFVGFAALLASGIMAGFFWTYSFTVMWGLDRTDPRSAIDSMQGINLAVPNPMFLLFFMGLPLLLIAAAILFWQTGQTASLWLFAASTLLYLIGGIGITGAVNIPLNDGLARVTVPTDIAAARDIWTTYTAAWMPWTHLRTALTALAFALAGLGLFFSAT
jgi:uncharacterized membrane protein